jgi:hypothetical protein
MKKAVIAMAKTAAVWAALLAGTVIGGLIVGLPAQPAGAADEPLTSGQAFLLVDASAAIVLALLAAHMPGPARRRAAILFALLFALGTLLSDLEARYFGSHLNLPDGLLAGVAVMNALKAGLAAIVAAMLWRPDGRADPLPAGLWWRLPAIAVLYVPFYFGAGFLIAWQSATVRSFYGDGLAIDNVELALFQIGRGAIWAALAWLAAVSLAGSRPRRALLTGAAFAILMGLPLLYPNGFMPWPVRSVHLVEIGVSNLLFGIVAFYILASGFAVDRKNRQDAPAGAI